MYKRILVAVDGSDTSNLALKEAVNLAKEHKATLRLIHIVDETPAYTMVDSPYPVADYQKILREAGEKVLAASANKVRDAGVAINTKLAIVESLTQRICDVINEDAANWPADLIVIGTHGRRGFNHLLLGSVAEGVIRLAKKPVLIIRGG